MKLPLSLLAYYTVLVCSLLKISIPDISCCTGSRIDLKFAMPYEQKQLLFCLSRQFLRTCIVVACVDSFFIYSTKFCFSVLCHMNDYLRVEEYVFQLNVCADSANTMMLKSMRDFCVIWLNNWVVISLK